jgi:hypothetical protein
VVCLDLELGVLTVHSDFVLGHVGHCLESLQATLHHAFVFPEFPEGSFGPWDFSIATHHGQPLGPMSIMSSGETTVWTQDSVSPSASPSPHAPNTICHLMCVL